MSRWGIALLLAAIMCGCAVSEKTRAPADNWVVLSTSRNGDTVAVNPASVLRNGNMVTYQYRETFEAPRPVFSGDEIAAILNTVSVKCDERTAATLSSESVSSTGSHQPMLAGDPVYRVVPDDGRTPAGLTFNYVCGLR